MKLLVLAVLLALLILGLVLLYLKKKRSSSVIKSESPSSPNELTKPASVKPQPTPDPEPLTETSAVEVKLREPMEILQQIPLPEAPPEQKKQQVTTPEDSVLKRHYLANQEAERQAITHPYPTDSVLRRHVESYSRLLITPSKPAIEVSEIAVEAQTPTKNSVPEDSILRRHFLTQLQTTFEATLTPKPTDSVLRRHYENLVKTKLAEYLAGNALLQ